MSATLTRSISAPTIAAMAALLLSAPFVANAATPRAATVSSSAATTALPPLPARVKRIVLHTLGGPFYRDPTRRWVFYPPRETMALWRKPGFGAHWIVWTDGSVWPRHPRRGDSPSYLPPVDRAADEAWRARLAREAAPVYAHVVGENADSVGIEVAHSGRRGDAFPGAQVRSVAWLLRTLIDMSAGRLTAAGVVGHKDLDDRPAYVDEGCQHEGCAFYVDDGGRPYRRRVDPPEGLFAVLAGFGIDIPRAGSEGDREIERGERILEDRVPRVSR
jgi:hypothetical protein